MIDLLNTRALKLFIDALHFYLDQFKFTTVISTLIFNIRHFCMDEGSENTVNEIKTVSPPYGGEKMESSRFLLAIVIRQW